MNKLFALVGRNLKEISRDAVSISFCIVLPAVMLIVMQIIFINVPKDAGAVMFEIGRFAPAIVTFGYSFTALYVALTVSGDKGSAFITRLNVAPIKPWYYLLSQVISALPLMLFQTLLLYAVSFIFGLGFNGYTFLSVIYLIPSAIFYLSVGIFIGSVAKSDKQAGPISSIFITAGGLLGGVWMPLEVIGGGFLTFCKCLPFYSGVSLAQNAVAGNLGNNWLAFLITLAYAAVLFTLAVIIFKRQMKK